MPTVGGDLTTTAVNLVTKHSLTVGSTYSIVNSGRGVVLLAEAASDPSATLDNRHWAPLLSAAPDRLPGTGMLIVRSDMGIWAKTLNGETSYSINEAS